MCGFPSRVAIFLRRVKDTVQTIDLYLQRDRKSMVSLRLLLMRVGYGIVLFASLMVVQSSKTHT